MQVFCNTRSDFPFYVKSAYKQGCAISQLYDLTIHDPMMHDSYINYLNQFKSCRKNHNHYATRAIFCRTKDQELLLYANKCSFTSRGI